MMIEGFAATHTELRGPIAGFPRTRVAEDWHA